MQYILNVLKDILTSEVFLTVISGVLVFIVGQLFNEYFLKPIQNYKQLRAKIAYYLTLYAQFYMNPLNISEKNDEYSSASEEMRKLAAEVDAMIELKPWGNFFIARKKVLHEVSRYLIGLSNGFYTNNTIATMLKNDSGRDKIYSLLKIKCHFEKMKGKKNGERG